MKLGEVARHVVAFLCDHPDQEFTANTLLMHLGLPLREKRRLYDVIEVLSSAGLVDVRKDARKRYFHWIPQLDQESTEIMEVDRPADPIFRDAGTVLHALVHFNTNAFQELSNNTALKMLERDIKRALWGANAASVIRLTLKNDQGRILKEAATTGVQSAAVY